jgi:predicted patatin/cPLA2 family phospholipase
MDIIGDHRVIEDMVAGRTESSAIFALPGGRAGVVSAGMLSAMADRGIGPETFSVAAGTSSGGINLAAFCANQAHIAPTIYSDMCKMYPLVSRDWIQRDLLEGVLRGKVLKGLMLDQDAIRKSRTKLLIGISDLMGRGEICDARYARDIVTLLMASASAKPLVDGIVIDGKECVDGAHAHPCPVVKVVRDNRLKSVLVIGNRPQPAKMPLAEWMMFPRLAESVLFVTRESSQFRQSTREMDKKLADVVRMIKKKRKCMKICAIFPSPNETVSTLEYRSKVIENCGKTAHDSMMRLLDKHHTSREV